MLSNRHLAVALPAIVVLFFVGANVSASPSSSTKLTIRANVCVIDIVNNGSSQVVQSSQEECKIVLPDVQVQLPFAGAETEEVVIQSLIDDGSQQGQATQGQDGEEKTPTSSTSNEQKRTAILGQSESNDLWWILLPLVLLTTILLLLLLWALYRHKRQHHGIQE